MSKFSGFSSLAEGQLSDGVISGSFGTGSITPPSKTDLSDDQSTLTFYWGSASNPTRIDTYSVAATYWPADTTLNKYFRSFFIVVTTDGHVFLFYGSVADTGKVDYTLDPTTGQIHIHTARQGDFDAPIMGFTPMGSCFLAGTLIQTAQGVVPVEALKIGDQLSAYIPQAEGESQLVTRNIIWAGSATVRVDPTKPDDLAGYPVRIRKDAFGRGLPLEDLLVTSEHCFYFEGGFMPIRMLVNDRSIFYDRSFNSYTYYHIETDPHAIIFANGLATESYLDNGLRRLMRQKGPTASVRPSQRLDWALDAAADLIRDPEICKRLYVQFENRAIEAGMVPRSATPRHTADNGLRLVTDLGETLSPHLDTPQRASFTLPPGTKWVRVLSRASRPSDVVGPYVDDRRVLGVLIGDICLKRPSGDMHYTRHLEPGSLEGWHAFEIAEARWTTGNALISLPEPLNEPTVLSLSIVGGGPYLLMQDTAGYKVA